MRTGQREHPLFVSDHCDGICIKPQSMQHIFGHKLKFSKAQNNMQIAQPTPSNPHPRLTAGKKGIGKTTLGSGADPFLILCSFFFFVGAIPSAACVKRLLSDLSPVYTLNYTGSREKKGKPRVKWQLIKKRVAQRKSKP